MKNNLTDDIKLAEKRDRDLRTFLYHYFEIFHPNERVAIYRFDRHPGKDRLIVGFDVAPRDVGEDAHPRRFIVEFTGGYDVFGSVAEEFMKRLSNLSTLIREEAPKIPVIGAAE